VLEENEYDQTIYSRPSFDINPYLHLSSGIRLLGSYLICIIIKIASDCVTPDALDKRSPCTQQMLMK
jgi:hypothetical protein